MTIVATVAQTLQALLGPVAQRLADQHRLIRRQRRFSATTLLQTFVLGYLHKPTARVADLAATAEALGVRVSPQAVEARFQPALQHALYDLWQHAAAQLVRATPRAVALLQRFTHVLVGDSTSIALTDALADTYPGCGGTGTAGRAALKIQVQWDLLAGTLTHAAIEPGTQADATSSSATRPPPAGSLVLYDLGYFHLDRFADWNRRGVRWISRGLSRLTITLDGRSRDLIDWLATQRSRRIDRTIVVGANRVPCRLIALRLPPALAARRRRVAIKKAAKKKGRRPSRHHLASCAWTIYLTNCPASQLASHEVEVLYRLRWQIELLFKLWKSHNHLADHRHTDPVRQMIELLARLIAVLVQHWLLLTSGWDDPQLSLVKATRRIRERMPLLIEAMADRPRLEAVLHRLVEAIRHHCRLNTRRRQPNAAQLLQNPELQKHRSLT
jgi:hypothetical protein